MFFKKIAFSLTSLGFLLFLSTQVSAGGVFYSTEGDTIRVPNDTQMIIILKKGAEITALDSRGNAIASCETCENDLENTKMLVTLNKDGNLDVIGGTSPKDLSNKTAVTQQNDFIQTVTEGIKLRKITKQKDAQFALLLTRDAKPVVVNVNTGRMLQPKNEQKAPHEKMDNNTMKDDTKTVPSHPTLSDAEFAELKRKFDHTIAVEVTRGSECINFTWTPPGLQFRDCSPPSVKWW